MTDSRSRWLLALLLAGVTCLALAWRWPLARVLNLGSDGLGQWSAALAVLHGGVPTPPNPEGGHSLWIFGLPPVLLGRSLLGVAQVRVVMAALVAPLGAASAWWLGATGPGRWAAAVLTGVWLAVDPGLLDTLQVAFRGYGAPELVALAGLGLAATRTGWRVGPAVALVALLAAAGQHPMAGGVLIAGTLAVWGLRASVGPRALGGALALMGLLALGRVGWLWRLGQCGAGWVACLGRVASGSSEATPTSMDFVVRALHDRWLVDAAALGWAPAGIVLIAVILLLVRPGKHGHAVLLWAALATAGIIALGLGVHSLRPYHLRIVAAPIAVVVGLGLSRVWPLALVVAALSLGAVPRPVVAAGDGSPAHVDALAVALRPDAGPVRIDAVWYGDPVGVEPAPVVVSMVLQGMSADRLQARADVPVVLLVNTDEGRPRPDRSPMAVWDTGYALRFDRLTDAVAWVDGQVLRPVVEGGAFDWVKALHPDDPGQDAVSWTR